MAVLSFNPRTLHRLRPVSAMRRERVATSFMFPVRSASTNQGQWFPAGSPLRPSRR